MHIIDLKTPTVGKAQEIPDLKSVKKEIKKFNSLPGIRIKIIKFKGRLSSFLAFSCLC